MVSSQIPAELDSIANARACSAPAIFLLAERDRTIPPPHQLRIMDAYGGAKQMILQRGADHFVPLSKADEALLQDAIDRLAPLLIRAPRAKGD